MDGVKILAVEPSWFEQGVRDAIHIRMEQPSLNKDMAFPLSGKCVKVTSQWDSKINKILFQLIYMMSYM